MTFTQRESWTGSAEIGGRKIHLETGKIARQANGSVLIRQGDTVVLVTAVAAKVPREGTDFFPLTVEFRGRLSAAGRYPGGYRKREGRISDREILSSRLIDRTIRPLFPDGYRCEVQVIANVLAYEPGGDPEVLAITGAAAALHLSDIPFSGPVAGLRVVKASGGEILAFPDKELVNGAALDLVASIGPGGLVMVEGLAQEVPEADVMRAIETAAEAARPLFALLEQARSSSRRSRRPRAGNSGGRWRSRRRPPVRKRPRPSSRARGRGSRKRIRTEKPSCPRSSTTWRSDFSGNGCWARSGAPTAAAPPRSVLSPPRSA
jgi:polyribonucleotide nucleotidyltransferase